jgi:hypothetical protein
MFRILHAFLLLSLVSTSFSNLQAIDSMNISNQAHVQWPNVTEEPDENWKEWATKH